MRWVLLATSLAIGCGQGRVVDIDWGSPIAYDGGSDDIVRPGVPFQVELEGLFAGARAKATVQGAEPFENVRIAMGASGSGPCPAPLGGLCLDVEAGPVLSVITNASGEGDTAFEVPTNVGLEVCAQAVAARGVDGADSVKSDVFCDVVESYDLEGTIYMASGTRGASGNLFELDLATLTYELVGPVMDPTTGRPYGLTGMAFGPDGTLYGVTSTSGGSREPGFSQLLTMDPATGHVTLIGQLIEADGSTHDSTPDITFVGSRLVGWTESGDDPIEIDPATGLVTVLGSGTGSYGSGIAWDGGAKVYLIPDSEDRRIWLVDVSTGIVSETDVSLSGGSGEGDPINSMIYHNDILLGVASRYGIPGRTNLRVINPTTGVTFNILQLPSSIDALAGDGAP